MTFEPGWIVAKTGRPDEKLTPANLMVARSAVGTYRREQINHRLLMVGSRTHTCATFATSKTADLTVDTFVFELVNFPDISCIPLSLSVGGRKSGSKSVEGEREKEGGTL